jgi:hypothetical protein
VVSGDGLEGEREESSAMRVVEDWREERVEGKETGLLGR